MVAQLTPKEGFVLGLDVGGSRVGLALAHTLAKLPKPYGILANSQDILDQISKIIQSEDVITVVVGLPRDMSGAETPQSAISKEFALKLARLTNAEIKLADESLSSIRAESSTQYKGTSPKYKDDIAACYILEEFFGVNKI